MLIINIYCNYSKTAAEKQCLKGRSYRVKVRGISTAHVLCVCDL